MPIWQNHHLPLSMMLPVEYIVIAMHVHGWLLCSLVLYLALDMPPSITINLVIKHTSMHPSIHNYMYTYPNIQVPAFTLCWLPKYTMQSLKLDKSFMTHIDSFPGRTREIHLGWWLAGTPHDEFKTKGVARSCLLFTCTPLCRCVHYSLLLNCIYPRIPLTKRRLVQIVWLWCCVVIVA